MIQRKTIKAKKYQDYVIKDGKFIGDFDGLYKNFDDPWYQSGEDSIYDSRRLLAVSWCKQLRKNYNCKRIVDLGCGFGHLTEQLRKQKFVSLGIDISSTAIHRARKINPLSNFLVAELNQFEKISQFNPDIFLMSEITWYVLEVLQEFLQNLQEYKQRRKKPTFLIHLLTTYAPEAQRYGVNYFTDLDEIMNYFNLNYIESGYIQKYKKSDTITQGSYFIAEI